jgi:Tol biopolymer transport system component
MPGIFQGLRLSPEGLRLALDQNIGGNSEVWVIHLGLGVSSRRTFDASADVNPVWSPDGTQIVFSSSRLGPLRMFILSPGGGGSDQPLPSETPSGMQDIAEDWSPDGKYIVFCRYPQGAPGADIWVKPMSGDGKPFPFVQSKSFINAEPRVSPDGRWLAYTTNESGTLQIVVQTFPDPTLGKFMVTADGGVYPNWSRYGQELYYLALDGKLMAVPVKDDGNKLDFGEPTVLFQSPLTVPILPGASPYDVSADGKRFVFIVNSTTNLADKLTTIPNWTAALHREVKEGTEPQAIAPQITDRSRD